MINSRGTVAGIALVTLVAAVCVRLGFWQLDRLDVRRMRNAQATASMAREPIGLQALIGPGREVADSGVTPRDEVRYRKVQGIGVALYDREVVVAGRPRNGSPGVHIATPVAVGATDTLVLVLRGWVYSPDAQSVELGRWRESDTLRIEGYAFAYDLPSVAAATDSALPLDQSALRDSAGRRVRRLEHAVLERAVGAPLAGYYVLMTGGGGTDERPVDSLPARITPAALSDGSHLSYAVQWFLFAAIFGVGGPLVLIGRRHRRKSEVRQ